MMRDTAPTTLDPRSGPGYDPPAMAPGQGRSGPRPTRARRESGLPRRLTSERLRRGLTQSGAASLVGVDLATWQRWETGSSSPRGRLVLAALERFLRGE